MQICKTVADGVGRVLAVYHCTAPSWELSDDGICPWLTVNGERIPFFWWRTDTQVAMMSDLAPERKLCSMKLNRTCAKSEGLDRLLYRELDTAERMLESKIVKVMCYRKEHAMTMLATMENERVAIFELAAVLHDGTDEQGRHTYWGQDGMASDRVVSQKVASDAIYLFTEDEEKPETYNDIFLYMYGLNKTDAVKATAIAEILMGRTDTSDWCERDAHYRRVMAAVALSAQTGERITVGEVQA